MNSVSSVKIMGVINVTPDSFSDGGEFDTLDAALAQADKLIAEGADILDIGGESTRPFSDPVSTTEELERVIPVIQGIRRKHSVTISIDTSKAAVAREAIDAGANMLNDVTALLKDPQMIAVAQETVVPIIIMHMQGTPANMQLKPTYTSVIDDIVAFFKERITTLTDAGIDKNRIIVDPGIGFGKAQAHNLSILKHLHKFSQLGVQVMLAHSRKSFLGNITEIPVEADRDLATAIVTALCSTQNIQMVRVHNVEFTRQALKIAEAIQTAH